MCSINRRVTVQNLVEACTTLVVFDYTTLRLKARTRLPLSREMRDIVFGNLVNVQTVEIRLGKAESSTQAAQDALNDLGDDSPLGDITTLWRCTLDPRARDCAPDIWRGTNLLLNFGQAVAKEVVLIPRDPTQPVSGIMTYEPIICMFNEASVILPFMKLTQTLEPLTPADVGDLSRVLVYEGGMSVVMTEQITRVWTHPYSITDRRTLRVKQSDLWTFHIYLGTPRARSDEVKDEAKDEAKGEGEEPDQEFGVLHALEHDNEAFDAKIDQLEFDSELVSLCLAETTITPDSKCWMHITVASVNKQAVRDRIQTLMGFDVGHGARMAEPDVVATLAAKCKINTSYRLAWEWLLPRLITPERPLKEIHHSNREELTPYMLDDLNRAARVLSEREDLTFTQLPDNFRNGYLGGRD